MENLEPIRKEGVPYKKTDGPEEKVWMSDEDIREALSESPFYKDLNETTIENIIKMVKRDITENKTEH